ncbi:MAG: metallophosphoesterase [Clostridia bacterium]
MSIYYTSDLHLLHKKCIEMCNRPFKDIEEMHKVLITKWNNKVKNGDTVCVLGDIAFARNLKQIDEAYNLISQLNGNKILIRGNHDGKAIKNEKFKSLFKYTKLYDEINDNGRRLVLSHYPFEDWVAKHRGSYHLHGHVHSNDISSIERRHNCCVDVNDFEPKTLDELIVHSEDMNSFKSNKPYISNGNIYINFNNKKRLLTLTKPNYEDIKLTIDTQIYDMSEVDNLMDVNIIKYLIHHTNIKLEDISKPPYEIINIYDGINLVAIDTYKYWSYKEYDGKISIVQYDAIDKETNRLFMD